MTTSARGNWLRAVEFRTPQWIPCSAGFAPLTWRTLGQDLMRRCLDHPRINPREGDLRGSQRAAGSSK